MPVFPTVTNGFVITTGTSNVSYTQIVGSLASTSYKVKQIYLYASDFNQLSTSYTFSKQTPDGQSRSFPSSVNPNPYQYQNAYYWSFEEGDSVIFDNNTLFNFQLNPYSFVQMMLFVDFDEPTNLLK